MLARLYLAAVLAELGEFAEAIAAGEEGLRIAQTAGQFYSEVWARFGLGYAHLRHGDFAAAARVLEPGVALCQATVNRLALPSVAASLGSAYLWSGRTDDAVLLLEEAIEANTAMRILGMRSWFITFLAEAYLVLERITEAREQAEQAVALARAHAPAEAEQAGDAYRQALAAATELGLRPLVAHCHFSLAKLYRQTNNREQAREHFTSATTMYREMDMRFWLQQAEVEMKGLV